MDGKQEHADKFTPGTWRAVKPEGAPYWGIHTDAQSYTVAGTASGLCEADAKLIAAAPDMYAALDLIDALVRECLLGATKLVIDDERLARVTSAINSARVALARAEGRP